MLRFHGNCNSDVRHNRQEYNSALYHFFSYREFGFSNSVLCGVPTDFSKILANLREWGVNDYKMAELTGIERSKLSKFRTGDRKNPTYDDGVEIMKIYKAQKRQHDE